MTERLTSHHTVVVRRTLAASAKRVFGAWSTGAALQRWYVPGDGTWRSEVLDHEFRVGGVKRLSFGPAGEAPYLEDCRYEDIVEDRRICFVMTISRGAERFTTSLVTVELAPRGGATELTVTDQLAVLDGSDSAEGRERGWGETLDKLPAEVSRSA